MGLFNRVVDFATNNISNYQKENETYSLAVSEIESIENLLDFYTKEDSLASISSDLYKKVRIKIIDINNQIYINKRNLAQAKTNGDYQRILKKIDYLLEQLEILIAKAKNDLLVSKSLGELQDHLTALQVIINGNARYEPFINFVAHSYWTIEDLTDIRNKIAERRTKIIPYLGDRYRR